MPSASDGRVPATGVGSRRRADSGAAASTEYSVEVATEVGEAMAQLAARLSDPAVAHTIGEIEQVTHGFAATADAISHGLGGITEQLRAAGHAGPLSGHASVVADRLVHASRELTRLAEALGQATQDGRSS